MVGIGEKYGWFTIFICIFVAFGGFLFGYDTANIGGVVAMDNWLYTVGYVADANASCGSKGVYDGVTYCISSTNKALITSLLSVGTCIGALSGAAISDNLGRKGGILVASTVFLLGALIQTAVASVGGLIGGRVVAGFGVGLISMMIPMYQAECAPPHIRGAIVSFYQFSITVGILVAQGVDLGTKNMHSTAAWRIPVGIQMAFALLLIIGCLFIPESPRYLIRRGKVDEGRHALSRMRSQPENSEIINAEMAEIQGNLEFEMSLGKSTYADCFRGTMRSRTWIGILVQMFQQLTGVNFIFYYGTSFFVQSGISQPYLITLATGIMNVGMTIPGIYMVERLGRRKFLLGGAIWMSFCQLIVGSVAVAKGQSSAVAGQVLVAFTLLFIAGFASTWGPGAWVLISEIYPLKLRGKAMSLATFSNWFWNWLIAFCVPYITDPGYGNLGSKIAFIWFATSLCAAIWVYFVVPETRRHSLEELDEMFEARIKPNQTASWKPSGVSLHARGLNEGLHSGAIDSKIHNDSSTEKVAEDNLNTRQEHTGARVV